MKDVSIKIKIKNDQLTVEANRGVTSPEYMEIFAKVNLAIMQQTLANASEENRARIEDELYDLYNIAASNTLMLFAPGKELRPNLTAQAILEAENAIIDREYQKTVKDPTYRSPIKTTAEEQSNA
jgi:predicted metal-dependent hydrolase